MTKNLSRYYKAWKLRQQGKKLKEIAELMDLKSGEWVRDMINHFNFKLNNKFNRLPLKYKKLVLGIKSSNI